MKQTLLGVKTQIENITANYYMEHRTLSKYIELKEREYEKVLEENMYFIFKKKWIISLILCGISIAASILAVMVMIGFGGSTWSALYALVLATIVPMAIAADNSLANCDTIFTSHYTKKKAPSFVRAEQLEREISTLKSLVETREKKYLKKIKVLTEEVNMLEKSQQLSAENMAVAQFSKEHPSSIEHSILLEQALAQELGGKKRVFHVSPIKHVKKTSY